jgi:hypothetical protein
MHDIHTLYRIAYGASLAAQLISLQARLEYIQQLGVHHHLYIEARITQTQIAALQAEVDRLNK